MGRDHWEATAKAHLSMEDKTVWMVSGNKGGVGKSLFCLALASALDTRGESYAILDGDGRTGDVFAAFLKRCPAKWADFRMLRPESPNCVQDGVYESMIRALLSTSQHLIVNTPDGADSMLMKWFDLTLGHTEKNNFLFKFMYLMSDRSDGLDLLPGLAERFSFFYPIQNRKFGTEDLFAVFNRDYARLFNEVVEFPILRGEEARMLFDVKTFPAEAMRLKLKGKYTIPALSRARLLAWQSIVSEALSDIIDNRNNPNSKSTTLCV